MRDLMVSEPDFMIKGFLKFRLFGQELWITSTTLGMTAVTLVIVALAAAASVRMRRADMVPGRFQNVLEYAVDTLESFVTGVMGKRGHGFVNYVGSILLFILFCNVSGLLGIRTPTADFGVTFILGVMTFLIVQYQGIKNFGFRHFTNLFRPFPILFPINVIGELSNPISLSLRLFGNMVSGVIIMGLWYGMMPIWARLGVPAFLHVYFDLFSGCIQTYVFCMLTMVYVNEKLD